MALNVSSYFQYYIFHPNKLPEEIDRNMVLITSIALGVLTLGLLHIFCYAALYDRSLVVKKTSDEQEKKTKTVFDETVPKSSKEVDTKEKKEKQPHKVKASLEKLPAKNVAEKKEVEIKLPPVTVQPIDDKKKESKPPPSTENKIVEDQAPQKKPRRRRKKKVRRPKTPHNKVRSPHRDQTIPKYDSITNSGNTTGTVPVKLPLKHLRHTPPENKEFKTASSAVFQTKEGDRIIRDKTPNQKRSRRKSHKSKSASHHVKVEKPPEKKPSAPSEGENKIYKEPKFVKFHDNTEVRLESAKKWAEEGQKEYQILLGGLYLFGRSGVKKSRKDAAYWYTKAVNEHQSPLAQYRLGKMYILGCGVKRSLEKGLELMNASKQQGNKYAIKYLEKHKLGEETQIRFKSETEKQLQESKN